MAGNLSSFPTSLIAYLDAISKDIEIESLHGMSGARIWRVRSPQGFYVIKHPKYIREILFYQKLAPRLRTQGIPIPSLEWSDSGWMVIEYIPQPLPLELDRANPEIPQILYRLHTCNIRRDEIPFELYRPQWLPTLTEQALELFPKETAKKLLPALDKMRDECQSLFIHSYPLSGDPNLRTGGFAPTVHLSCSIGNAFASAHPRWI